MSIATNSSNLEGHDGGLMVAPSNRSTTSHDGTASSVDTASALSEENPIAMVVVTGKV